jgi:hypothetical protein
MMCAESTFLEKSFSGAKTQLVCMNLAQMAVAIPESVHPRFQDIPPPAPRNDDDDDDDDDDEDQYDSDGGFVQLAPPEVDIFTVAVEARRHGVPIYKKQRIVSSSTDAAAGVDILQQRFLDAEYSDVEEYDEDENEENTKRRRGGGCGHRDHEDRYWDVVQRRVKSSFSTHEKLDAMVRDLEKTFHNQRRKLIFTRYKAQTQYLMHHLQTKFGAASGGGPKNMIAFIDGSIGLGIRSEILKRPPQFLIVNISCAACGLNLNMYQDVFFACNSWNQSEIDQAIARVFRIGQTEQVHIYKYIVDDSFDEYMEEIQHRKSREAKETIDGRGGHHSSSSSSSSSSTIPTVDSRQM